MFTKSFFFACLAILATSVSAGQSTLLVLGDSLSAAHGVPSETAWVQLLKQRMREQGMTDWEVINASIGGETTDGGLRRLPRLIESNAPDVVIIELGGNDGLRGFPPGVIKSNLSSMITLSQNSGASVVLVGMQIPPNYGQRYTSLFADIYPTLSDRYNTALVPFFLQGIYDHHELMQSDGIHPTEKAQPILLDNIWPVLKSVLHPALDSSAQTKNPD